MIRDNKQLGINLPVLLGLVMAISIPLTGVSRADDATATAPEPVEYLVEDIQGNVRVLEEGAKNWEPAEEGQVVEPGDEIKVGDKSEATLMLQGDTSVHLNAQADMKVEQIEANPTGGFLSRLQVLAGNILADVKKRLEESHSTFEVESNGVVCGVRGTAFEVTAQDDTAQVATYEGKVAVGNGPETHMVEAGNMSSFRRGQFQLQRRLDREDIQRFQKWRAFRQVILKKRFQRLDDIRNHRRAAWVRKHPHPRRTLLRREFRKRPRPMER